MSNLNTQWRISVFADTKAARTELAAFAKVAQATGMSMEQIFSNVKGAPVARTFNNIGRELDKMNSSVLKSQVGLREMNRYWKSSGNLVKQSKQYMTAAGIATEKTAGQMASLTAVMKPLKAQTAGLGTRLAYMNTFFQHASKSALNFAKNIQWAGRQITVGFGVPFGLAMTGASMAFLKVENQIVRFRKVFNEEINSLSVDEAEARIVGLANNLSTSLGIVRSQVLETAATFAQMGYKAGEIERLTKAATELSMLGEIDSTQATNILRAYSASGFKDEFIKAGGAVEDFEEVVKNRLNAIENSTGLTISAMAEHMAQLIPLFSQFGLAPGQGEAVVAGMTEALGGRSSEAVTSLKAIMQRFYSETTQTREEFAEIGVNIEQLQSTYKNDIVGGLAELGKILDENPAFNEDNEAVAETFGRLFGVRQTTRAIAGLRAINRGFAENGEAANDYGRALNAVSDDSKNAARAQQELDAVANSLGGRLKRLKESIMIEASDIGETFLEMIMPLAEMVGNAVKAFNNMSDGAKRFYMTSGLVVLGLSGILTISGVLIQAFIYIAKGIAGMFPKFKIWVDETFKTDMATRHLNDSMRHMTTTIGSLVPMYESIAAAQAATTASTNALTSAMTRQANASVSALVGSAVAKQRGSGYMPPSGTYGRGDSSRHNLRGYSASGQAPATGRRSGTVMPGGTLGAASRYKSPSTPSVYTPPLTVSGTQTSGAATRIQGAWSPLGLKGVPSIVTESAPSPHSKIVQNARAASASNSGVPVWVKKPGTSKGAMVFVDGEEVSQASVKKYEGRSKPKGLHGRPKVAKPVTNPRQVASVRASGSQGDFAPYRGGTDRYGSLMGQFGAGKTTYKGSSSIASRNSRLGAKPDSGLKWRSGMGAAGSLGVIGGSLVGGKAGNAMMSAGLGVQGLSLLASPKLMKNARGLSDSLLKSAKSSSLLGKGVKTAGAGFLSMAGSVPGIGIAVGAMAISGYLISKNIKEARAEAELMKNEFAVASDIGKDMGLSLEKSNLRLMSGATEDELEKMSDSMKAFSKQIREFKSQGDDKKVQSMFRNLAREWLAGGATIEEINDKLNELGDDMSVNVKEVTLEGLKETLIKDFTEALDTAIGSYEFDNSFWKSKFIAGQDLNAGSEQQAVNAGVTFAGMFKSGMSQEGFGNIIPEMLAENEKALKRNTSLYSPDGTVLDPEMLSNVMRMQAQAFGREFNLPDFDINGLVDMEDALSRVVSRTRHFSEEWDSLDSTQQGNILEMNRELESTGVYIRKGTEDLGVYNKAISTLMDEQNSLSIRWSTTSKEVGGALKMAREAVSTKDPVQVQKMIETMTKLSESARFTKTDVKELETGIKALTDYLSGTYTLSVDVKMSGDIAALSEADRFRDMFGGPRKKVEHEVGTEKSSRSFIAGSYNSALRSELDSQRDAMVSYVMDVFDKTSEQRMEKLEEARDARIDMMEEERDTELESIETARDAEIDAYDERIDKIDEYLERQREINEYRQDEIDLMVALASGDQGKAAQIQNSMRFGSIEDMAEDAKDALKDAQDKVGEEYDLKEERQRDFHEKRLEDEKELFDKRIEREKDARKAAKDSMESQLKDLDRMFLGSQSAMNTLTSEVARISGTTIPRTMAGGFDKAMSNVISTASLDKKWESLDLRLFEGQIEMAINDAIDSVVSGYPTRNGSAASDSDIKYKDGSARTSPSPSPSRPPTRSPISGTNFEKGLINRHTGGGIGSMAAGSAKQDVPAVLQTGEYVIQRSAAQSLGLDTLNMLNNYHTGGAVMPSLQNLGHVIGSNIGTGMGQGMMGGSAGSGAMGGVTGGGLGLEAPQISPNKRGGRTWGKIAPNTEAAQGFIKKNWPINFASAGTSRGDRLSDHSYGKATDIFPGTPGKYATGDQLETGNSIANWLMKNKDVFGTKYVIWQGGISNPSIKGGERRPYTRLKGVTGGHYDHVHASFLHSGGKVGSIAKKGSSVRMPNAMKKKTPQASNVMVSSNNSSGVVLSIGNFHGTEENIDRLVRKIEQVQARRDRSVNPSRSFG